jgi:hypothetical protein
VVPDAGCTYSRRVIRLGTAVSVLPLPCFLLLLSAVPAGAQPCSSLSDCDDLNDCTIDACESFTCTHEALAGGEGQTCDDDDPCTIDDRCTNGVCSGTPLTCDDGVACTDDFCDAGSCVHRADSTGCPAGGECATVTCAPDDPAADAQGCVVQTTEFELGECAEDDDPCTLDRCRTGVCAHDAVDDPQGCLPLLPSYRRATRLRAGVERIVNYVVDEADAGGESGDAIGEKLAGIMADLDAAVRILAGRDPGSPPPAKPLRGRPLAATATTSQQRGRVAFAWLRATPKRVRAFLGAVAGGRRHRDLVPDVAHELRRNGRILLSETKALKRDVKNLQRTFSVFQR